MIARIRSFLKAKAELARFKKLATAERHVVFYAEGAADWPHFEPIVQHLTLQLGQRICYVTSQEDDPILDDEREGVLPFFVGVGPVRSFFFQGLEAKIMVMTLPDLESSYLKRSAVAPVHYVYVFHAISSTHMVYQPHAFDAYDSVLCVGPHHVRELREAERVYASKAKVLIEHGYGRLDALLERAREDPEFVPSASAAKKVLVASSWGMGSLIEQPLGRELIAVLLEAGHFVTARLHPMTVRHHPKLVAQLEEEFSAAEKFRVETDMRSKTSLMESDIMIGDWSGAAFEYAFALERPVLFVDTPRKINNPEYEKVDLPPMEATIRMEIGDVIAVDAIGAASQKVRDLCADRESFRTRLIAARNRSIFNEGRSGEVASAYIAGLLAQENGE